MIYIVEIEYKLDLNKKPYEVWHTPHGICSACAHAKTLLCHCTTLDVGHTAGNHLEVK
jgi:hypothetical protein